jgi:hypothetical protein
VSQIRSRLIAAYTGKFKKASRTKQGLDQATKALVKLRAALEGVCMRDHKVSAWQTEANDDAFAGAIDQLVEMLTREVHFVIDGKVALGVLELCLKAEEALVALRGCVSVRSEQDICQDRRRAAIAIAIGG